MKMKINLDVVLDSFESVEEYIQFMKEEYNLNVEIHDDYITHATFEGAPEDIIKYLPKYGLNKSDLLGNEFNDIKQSYLKCINSNNENDYVEWLNLIK